MQLCKLHLAALLNCVLMQRFRPLPAPIRKNRSRLERCAAQYTKCWLGWGSSSNNFSPKQVCCLVMAPTETTHTRRRDCSFPRNHTNTHMQTYTLFITIIIHAYLFAFQAPLYHQHLCPPMSTPWSHSQPSYSFPFSLVTYLSNKTYPFFCISRTIPFGSDVHKDSSLQSLRLCIFYIAPSFYRVCK